MDGWPVDVAHYTEHEFARWLDDVRHGNGWQDREWPLPLFAVSGFAYGVLLADSERAGRRAVAQVESFPSALLDKARTQLANVWPGLRAELAGCVRRSDGWLFHEMAGNAIRDTYIAWFAAHRRYCPFPKRIAAWAQRFKLDPELLDLEQRIWRTGPLDQRLAVITTLVEGVLRIAQQSMPN